MIKIDKENLKIETDCKTVGEFMTQAAAIFVGNVTVIVDGCRYEFHNTPEIRVTDETPLGGVAVERADSLLSGVTVLRVTTKPKPKPKTVKKSGWINIYDCDGVRTTGRCIFETETGANFALSNAGYPKVATVRVEWEEVAE